MTDPTVTMVREQLEKDSDLAHWFAMLAESGPEAIEAQAWQMRETIADSAGTPRKDAPPLQDVADALLQIAHEELPESPSGGDPRMRMFNDLMLWASHQDEAVRKRLVDGMKNQDFHRAYAGSVAYFRRYLRGCCERALRECEAA